MLALATALEAALGSAVRDGVPVAGGDINDAYRVTLADGRRVFVKTRADAPHGMFTCERRGLAWLRAADALRIPECLAVVDGDDGGRFLALEWIAPGRPRPTFAEEFGRGLARLHLAGASSFGLDHDNFIGPLLQDNTRHERWAEFYRERRLAPQLARASARGLLSTRLQRAFDRVSAQLPELVGPDEAPARLHGDLWSGNVYCDDRGLPCLIDPAVYGGHREVDLAMLQLFGDPGARFLAAYDDAFPLAPGWRERVPLYQLYPLLVHVNLFGSVYVARLDACVAQVLGDRR